jgi:putative PIG3 family NAD(P)H quinone oxidoreductase
MRAIVIREPGDPDVLELRDVPSPPVYPGYVKIAVRYAGVNRADLLQRQGFYPAPPGAPADIPGLEYAGVVDEIGSGVTRLRVGDRVHGLLAGGGYAEHVVVHERETVKVIDDLDDAQAGAIPEIFVTAYDALRVRGRLEPGETVLIHAAGSGVGTAGIAIARALGCGSVIGTSRTPDKLDRCRALGLTHGVVPGASTSGGASFAKDVLAHTDGRGVDVVLDLVGGPYTAESLRCLAPKGRIVVVGLTGGRESALDLGLLLQRRATLVGTVLRARPLEEKIEAAHLLAGPIASLFAHDRTRPVIDRIFPLAAAAAAHRYVASDASFGKVLLDVRASA